MFENTLFVMTDLETLSLRSNAAIIAIGAVAFNLHDNIRFCFSEKIDPNSGQPPEAFHRAKETLAWWEQQSEEAREAAFGGTLWLGEVLRMFSHWFPKDGVIVGNGANFDVSILEHAYDYFGLPKPWSYKNVMCYRTIKQMHPFIEPEPFEGTKHRAFDDALHQAKHMRKIFREVYNEG